MDTERLDKLGQESYAALGACVEESIEEESSEHAVICGNALIHLAKAEGANYFGTEGYYNFNTAVELSKKALNFAKKEGVPRWLEDDVKDMERTLKELE